MESAKQLTLQEALGLYVSTLKTEDEASRAQQHALKFVHWFGADQAMSGLRPPEVGDYSEQAGRGGAQAVEHLQEVRRFLSFAKKKGLIEGRLAQHVRIPKIRATSRGTGTGRELIELTPDGHKQLEAEMDGLKQQRTPLALQIKSAAADKDVRENVPLEAAREQLGHVESRITEIEETLRGAVVVDPSQRGRGRAVAVGSKVVVKELDSGRETEYTIVNAAEADPLQGKISVASPVGKVLVTRTTGQEVDVKTPRGNLRYRILEVS